MLPANMHVIWRVSHDAAFSLLNQLPHDFKRIAGVLEKLRLVMGFSDPVSFRHQIFGVIYCVKGWHLFFWGWVLGVWDKTN